jgi:F0F1-type ATP synthase assembly protein I
MAPGRRFPSWVRHSGVGLELAGATAGFALLGYWVDRSWGTQPWGIVVGVTLGLIGGLYNLVKESLRAANEARIEDEAGQTRIPQRGSGGDGEP